MPTTKKAAKKSTSTAVAVRKNTAPANVMDEEMLAEMRNEFPQDAGFSRTQFPRIVFKSQDEMEGTGKNKTVAIEAGTFLTEVATDEVDEEGKKVFAKEELGQEIEAIILFQRKQLSYYDEATESYTSSPVYDSDEEILPLWCNKTEVHRGTPAELKAKYEYTDPKDNKVKSNLKDNRILYVLLGGVEGELYEMNLHGSSMYSFMSYTRKTLAPSVVTKMNSESKEKGKIEWNQMTFEPARGLDKKEGAFVIAKINELKEGIKAEKGFFAAQKTGASTDGSAAVKDEDDF